MNMLAVRDRWEAGCRMLDIPEDLSKELWERHTGAGGPIMDSDLFMMLTVGEMHVLVEKLPKEVREAISIAFRETIKKGLGDLKQSIVAITKAGAEISDAAADLRDRLEEGVVEQRKASEVEIRRVTEAAAAERELLEARAQEIHAQTIKDLSDKIAEAAHTAFETRRRTLSIRDLAFAGVVSAMALAFALSLGWGLGRRAGLQESAPAALTSRADTATVTKLLAYNPDLEDALRRNCSRTASTCNLPIWTRPPQADAAGGSVSLSDLVGAFQDWSLWIFAALGLAGVFRRVYRNG